MGWREEYLANILAAQQSSSPAGNQDLVDACSQLADRIAVLEAENAHLREGRPGERKTPSTSPSRPAAGAADAAALLSPDNNSQSDSALRRQLADALRARGQMQTRLRAAEEELQRLRGRSAADARAIRDLTTERTAQVRRVRDRDEELRVKKKLVSDVQDELTVLTLQLNVSEQKNAKLRQENEELVQRWMKRMGQEVDAMNLANEPALARRR